MKKTVLSLILAVLMLFGFAACDVLPDRRPDATELFTETETETEIETETVTETETAAPTETETEALTETETETETEAPTESVPEAAEDSRLEVWFLDVGQGDAACVVCDGEVMLVDGGNKAKSDLMYSFLKRNGFDHLKYVFASHPDADHVGGLAGALNYATVEKAFCTVTEYSTKAFENFTKYLGVRGVSVTVPSAGDVYYLGSAKITVIYPSPGEVRSDNTSIALRIQFKDVSLMFAGDCQDADEEAILSSGYELKSDVLKVSHHGGRNASSGAFLDAVRPSYAVISVGGDNSYGHPAEETLSALSARGATVFRTDMNGDVHLVSDGTSIEFDTEKTPAADVCSVVGGYGLYLEELARQERTQSAPDEETAAARSYVVNTNTKKFHYPSCSSVSTIKDKNRWDYTGTRDELLNMGYEPCKRCNP